MKSNCCICNKELESQEASVLTIGALGTPRYLCSECEAEFDVAGYGKDVKEIGDAMQSIGEKMASNESIGKVVFDSVNEIFDKARARAEKIKEGTYDFSLDEPVEIAEEEEEIPEEFLESDEDKALDEKQELRDKKVNKIVDWTTGIIFFGALIWVIYRIIRAFL